MSKKLIVIIGAAILLVIFGVSTYNSLVDKDEEDPQRGCFNSHKKCAKLALARNYNRVLVLEDDQCHQVKRCSSITRSAG